MLQDSLFAARRIEFDAFGVKGGLNLAKLKFSEENADQWKSDPGFQAGLFCTLKLNKMIMIQPEIYYVSKGVRINDTYFDLEMASTVKLDYIEVPLLLKVLLLPGKRALQPALFVGGYWAYNISAKSTFEFAGERVEDDIKEQITQEDHGILAGISIDWKTGIGKIVLDFRFSLGMKTLRKDGEEDEFKVKNKSMAFMIGYSF
jgi:hypothetical protein